MYCCLRYANAVRKHLSYLTWCIFIEMSQAMVALVYVKFMFEYSPEACMVVSIYGSFLLLMLNFAPRVTSQCRLLALSGIETSKWWQELRFDDNTEWEDSHIVIAVLFIVATILIVAWHFAEAWRILPGAYYVSGNININVVIKENLHRIYNVSRGLIVAYALLYAAFAFDAKDGFQQHFVLLAWVLSLIAQFKAKPSIVWLAICAGVFIQGFGAYRLRCERPCLPGCLIVLSNVCAALPVMFFLLSTRPGGGTDDTNVSVCERSGFESGNRRFVFCIFAKARERK